MEILGIGEAGKILESRIDVIEREQIEIGDSLAGEIMIVHCEEAESVDGLGGINGSGETEVLDGVRESPQMEGVGMREEYGVDGGSHTGKGLEEGGIKVIIPAAIDEEIERVDGDQVG